MPAWLRLFHLDPLYLFSAWPRVTLAVRAHARDVISIYRHENCSSKADDRRAAVRDAHLEPRMVCLGTEHERSRRKSMNNAYQPTKPASGTRAGLGERAPHLVQRVGGNRDGRKYSLAPRNLRLADERVCGGVSVTHSREEERWEAQKPCRPAPALVSYPGACRQWPLGTAAALPHHRLRPPALTPGRRRPTAPEGRGCQPCRRAATTPGPSQAST